MGECGDHCVRWEGGRWVTRYCTVDELNKTRKETKQKGEKFTKTSKSSQFIYSVARLLTCLADPFAS